jgi:hypothetical protein
MQNISAVLDELGMAWIPGLKPASNVGSNVKPRIVSRLEDNATACSPSPIKMAAYKAKLPAIRDWLIEIARSKGWITYGQVMNAFGIDRHSLRHAMDILGHQADNLDEPIITALIVGKSTGHCSSGFAKEFGVQEDETERKRLYEYWATTDTAPEFPEPAAADLEVKAARFVSVEARPDQAAFRRRVFLAFRGRCIVSGCDVVKALDAAHKHGRDWRLGHNEAKDGYLLRKDLHALYDNGLLSFTDDGRVVLSPSVVEHYSEFSGVVVRDSSFAVS